MSEEVERIHPPAAEISEEALKRAEEMIEREEGVQNKFSGAMAAFIIWVAVAMSLFHLYASYAIVRTHKEAENIKLENQKKDASPVPWHPGAVKYFAEKGIKLQ